MRWLSVAATAALLICATTFLMRDTTGGIDSPQPTFYAEVYIHGRKVADQQTAARIAEQGRRKSLARMDSLLHASLDRRDRQLKELRRLSATTAD